MQRIIKSQTQARRSRYSGATAFGELCSHVSNGCRQGYMFLSAVREADYLAAKAEDFKSFTCPVLLVTALFLAGAGVCDYAIDPAHRGQTIGPSLFASGAVLLWAWCSWPNVHASMARVAAFVGPLTVEATFLQMLSMIDQESSYGLGGLPFFFIVVLFLVLAQSLLMVVSVVVVITVFPSLVAWVGLPVGLEWGIYEPYMWLGLLPMICIALLFEYLYWNIFRYRRSIEAQALTDALTGIHNRRHFLSVATACLALHQRHWRPASLLFVDIDRFKEVNDTYGHCTGDAAIRHVSCMLRAPLRASDLIARYGGEEFVVLLPETGSSTAMRIAERMRTAVAAEPCVNGVDRVRLTCSIGVASYRPAFDDPADIDALVRRADQALYEAKRRGRDRIMGEDDAVVAEPRYEKAASRPLRHGFPSRIGATCQPARKVASVPARQMATSTDPSL